MNRRSLLQLLGLAWPAAGAFAQGGRTARIVVPLGPGTISDLAARLVAPHLGASLGQTYVVDNKAGANGVIGVQDLMRSPPDKALVYTGAVAACAVAIGVVFLVVAGMLGMSRPF